MGALHAVIRVSRRTSILSSAGGSVPRPMSCNRSGQLIERSEPSLLPHVLYCGAPMQSLCSVTRERSARGTPQLALTECGRFVALTIVQSNTCTRQRVRAKIASSKSHTFSEPTLTTTQLSDSSAGVAHLVTRARLGLGLGLGSATRPGR